MTDRDFIQLYAEAPRAARSHAANMRMLRIAERDKRDGGGMIARAMMFASRDLDWMRTAYAVVPKEQVTR